MSKIWIEESVLHALAREADQKYPLETGGVLVGYVADDVTPVIVAAIGPGVNATHERTRFHPDHDWQCEQLDTWYVRSQGNFVYLGDWHTHPNASPEMSWLDGRTLKAIAQHDKAQCDAPLMLIGGGSTGQWRWIAHQYLTERWWGIRVDCRQLEIIKFKASQTKLISECSVKESYYQGRFDQG